MKNYKEVVRDIHRKEEEDEKERVKSTGLTFSDDRITGINQRTPRRQFEILDTLRSPVPVPQVLRGNVGSEKRTKAEQYRRIGENANRQKKEDDRTESQHAHSR